MGRWGRQSPIETVDPQQPPPLPPRKSIITRQSSFTKLGQILNSAKNGVQKKPQSKFKIVFFIFLFKFCNAHNIYFERTVIIPN